MGSYRGMSGYWNEYITLHIILEHGGGESGKGIEPEVRRPVDEDGSKSIILAV